MSGDDDFSRIIDAARPTWRTSAGFVVDTLRRAIVSGAIPGGQAIRQEDLAARFGVSRMPVREALRRLEAEGLVDFVPHKGAVAASLSAEDAEEIAAMRVAAETLALRRSLPRLAAADLDRAAAVLDEMEAETDIARFGELNRRFHLTLYGAAPGKRLLQHVQSLHDAADRYLRVAVTGLDYESRSAEEHRALLAACRASDADRASALLAAHIESAGRSLGALLRARTRAAETVIDRPGGRTA